MDSHQNSSANDLHEVFGEVIFRYTRAQAIADGALVDVGETAKEAGFLYPVAVTASLWSVIETIPKAHSYQDAQGRLWDVLWMASLAIRKSRGESRVAYELIMYREGTRKKYVQLICDCGSGDDLEGDPVITIGFAKDF